MFSRLCPPARERFRNAATNLKAAKQSAATRQRHGEAVKIDFIVTPIRTKGERMIIEL